MWIQDPASKMEKTRIRDGKKSDPGLTSRIRNTRKMVLCFRVNLGPHEDIAKIYVMDQGRTPEIRQEGSHTLLHAKEYILLKFDANPQCRLY